jgi:Helix-turn-helix domain of resolvase
MLLLSVGPAMPEQSVIVWDLETIHDLPAAARMLDMSNATEPEVRDVLGEGFPKHPLRPKLTKHQIREIMVRLETGETCRSIAKSYNVSHMTISRID